jgi:hypothetical protein
MLHPYRGLREKLFQKVFSAPTGKRKSHPIHTIALHKTPSIIRPLKAVAMAAAFAFNAINLPIPFIFS